MHLEENGELYGQSMIRDTKMFLLYNIIYNAKIRLSIRLPRP
jgi:hypothetical protein